MGTNLLTNAGFEGGWVRKTHTGQEFGEIFVPESWVAFWREGGSVAHDPQNKNGYGRPEMHVINLEPPFLDPPRIRDGKRAAKLFTFYRIHDAGYYQQVAVSPGQRLRFTGWAHAWTSTADDPRRSTTSGDAAQQASFRVGIDPAGGTDPWGDGVIWGASAHLYDVYGQIPAVEATAQGVTVTVFVRSTMLWPFKHCDAYLDGMMLDEVSTEQPEKPEKPPVTPVVPVPTVVGYPVVATGSKLHPHALGEGGTYDVVHYLAESGYYLPFLKFVASKPKDLPGIRSLKALSPSTRIIGRLIETADNAVNIQGPGFGQLSGSSGPERYMAEFLPSMREYADAVDYWELWNEQDPVGTAGHVQMARFAIACMEIAEREGVKLALMSYSTGVPEPEEWRAIWEQTGFFQLAKAGGHILSLHAYSRTADAEATTYHLLRPTWLYDEILIPNDCVVPFIHTEYSVDDDIRNWSTADLMAEYARADALLSGLWYCLGASVFTFGLGWEMYNHNARWQAFADLVLATRGRANALPPDVEEPPVEHHDRYVIIADPTYMDAAQLDAAYARGRVELCTVTPRWQDAVPLAKDRPAEWASNTVNAGPLPKAERERYRDWVRARDPGTFLVFDPIEPPE